MKHRPYLWMYPAGRFDQHIKDFERIERGREKRERKTEQARKKATAHLLLLEHSVPAWNVVRFASKPSWMRRFVQGLKQGARI